MQRLDGKVAIVTGAARGIGAACAEALAREGAAVMLTDVLREQGMETAAALRAKGYRAAFHAHDVGSETQWQDAIDVTLKEFGGLDILVNNAGISIPASIEEMALEDFEKTLRINLIGGFLGMKLGIKAMKRHGGAIVNIASNSTKNVLPLTTAYSASKAGLANLTKVAALHCAAEGYNIRVNSVHPGPTETMMMTGGAESVGDIPQVRQLVEAIPLRRLGQPAEIAAVVAFLASDAASYMTGDEVFADGGVTVSLAK